jgi:hypothetical protein
MTHNARTLVTHIFRTHSAEQIIDSITNEANTYYLFAGNHLTYDSGDSSPSTPNNSVDCLNANTYMNMTFGKKITSSDVLPMIARYNWTANTVYTMYEHDNADLLSNTFYVNVDAGEYQHVFKCLFNNNGANSTIQPDFASSTQESNLFDTDDGYYETSDGYQWKYMFSIPHATFDKFATSDFIPVVANTEVTDAAIDGSIDVIKVETGGYRYDNYFNSVFASGDLRVSSTASELSGISSERLYSLGSYRSSANSAGSVSVTASQSNITGTSTTFTSDYEVGDYVKVANSTAEETKRISAITNNTLMTISGAFTNTFTGANTSLTFPYVSSASNDFYNDCMIKIVAGTASGEYRRIVDYVNDGNKKIAVLESKFTVNPDTTSRYQVSPRVMIYGDGGQTTNCEARAIVNSAAANSVYKIEVLERGAGYIKATANVLYSNVIPVSNTADIKPIVSPPGGHGYDVSHELGVSNLGISVNFANGESNTISTDNDFRMIGIMKEPLFANVNITMKKLSDNSSGSDGTFLVNEKVYHFDYKRLAGTISVSTTANTANGTSTDLYDSLIVGDDIIIRSGNSWMLSNVSSTTNATHITIGSNAVFTNTAAYIYIANLCAEAYVTQVTSGTLTLTNVSSFFETNNKIIGTSSHAIANVANVAINGINKDNGFDTFNQMTFFTGTVDGTFIEDEVVYQGNLSSANARFHSGNSTSLYVTNMFGNITTGTIVGVDSGAVFTATTKYNGEIVPTSGQVIYLQNGSKVSRANTQTETIKVIVEF